jgi:hypothetical protein
MAMEELCFKVKSYKKPVVFLNTVDIGCLKLACFLPISVCRLVNKWKMKTIHRYSKYNDDCFVLHVYCIPTVQYGTLYCKLVLDNSISKLG